jgi:hypothetical protein
MQDGIVIEYLAGNCPVQAEGTIDGKRFYFRARGESWRIEIHPTATGDVLSWGGDGWHYTEPYGDGPFAAGWMPEDEARQMIEKAALIYRRTQERVLAALGLTSDPAILPLREEP